MKDSISALEIQHYICACCKKSVIGRAVTLCYAYYMKCSWFKIYTTIIFRSFLSRILLVKYFFVDLDAFLRCLRTSSLLLSRISEHAPSSKRWLSNCIPNHTLKSIPKSGNKAKKNARLLVWSPTKTNHEKYIFTDTKFFLIN